MGEFSFDVCLSFLASDASFARELSDDLESDGVSCLLDQRPENATEYAGLETNAPSRLARTMLLVVSRHAASAQLRLLEAASVLFRDPADSERRFLIVKLDDVALEGPLGRQPFVDWQSQNESEYAKLLDACRPRLQTAPDQGAGSPRASRVALSFGHADAVLSVALSPDGMNAASASVDGTVRIWDLRREVCTSVLEGHTGHVWSVGWSPDGRLIASGCADGTLRVWLVADGSCQAAIKVCGHAITSVAWSPTGEMLLVAAQDLLVRLYSMQGDTVLAERTRDLGSVPLAVEWSPDATTVVAGTVAGDLIVLEVPSLRVERRLRGHGGSVRTVVWSRTADVLMSGSADRTVRSWSTREWQSLRVFEGFGGSVLSVAMAPDAKSFLAGTSASRIVCRDIESGGVLFSLDGHSDRVWSLALSRDGTTAVSGSADRSVRIWDVASRATSCSFGAAQLPLSGAAFASDGATVFTGERDCIIRAWEASSGRRIAELAGHSRPVTSMSVSPDGQHLLSAAEDNTIRLWRLPQGQCIRVFAGHTGRVLDLAWTPDSQKFASASEDRSVRLWDVRESRGIRQLQGHTAAVFCLAWANDGRQLISGGNDGTVRLWHSDHAECVTALEGHSGTVTCLAWSPGDTAFASGASDRTVRLWDRAALSCLRVLEGHSKPLSDVAYSSDGRYLLSAGGAENLRLWDTTSWEYVFELGNSEKLRAVGWTRDRAAAFGVSSEGVVTRWQLQRTRMKARGQREARERRAREQLQYTNAKVLLVGEGTSGKTGLAMRLATGRWAPTDTTVGAWATQWQLLTTSAADTEREVWLWDFGGQADQRLIHQLYMKDTSVAILVFDPQKDEVLDVLTEWDTDLARVADSKMAKVLVAGRVDAGTLRVDRREIDSFVKDRGYRAYVETSAKHDAGCAELGRLVLESIDWAAIPCRTTKVLFKKLKDEIVRLKDEGRVLLRFNEMRETLRLRLTGDYARFSDDDLHAVLTLLAGPGLVWELGFGGWVLLQPERINAYAQAVIHTLGTDEHQRGFISEERVLGGQLDYTASLTRLPADDERFVLLAMYQILIEKGLCLRQPTEKGNLLVFPGYFRRKRPDLPARPVGHVSFRFTGFLPAVYATLIVHLHHTPLFQQHRLWSYAADFITATGHQVGVQLRRLGPSVGELELYGESGVPASEMIVFTKYVHEHLLVHAHEVSRRRQYICPNCATPVSDRDEAMRRLSEWLTPRRANSRPARDRTPTIICVRCEQRVKLWDDLEAMFASPAIQRRVRELHDVSQVVLDAESKERVLVGEVTSTVALAGQLIRELPVGDHGIDMEIEFKDETHAATGVKVYLQLKSGDSHLRKSARDGKETFAIREERHARYWREQQVPVMLVLRSASGEVRWMEIREVLRQVYVKSGKEAKQIVFDGQRLDVRAVLQLRQEVLSRRRE